MDVAVKRCLNTETLTPFGRGGGGCINEGRSYVVDDGSKVYVKYKADKNGARRMFDGEMASLNAIAATGQIRVPKPFHVDDYPAGSFLVMEHLDMRSLRSEAATLLGTQLANLHLHNQKLVRDHSKSESFVGASDSPRGVGKFGFDVTTCCGFLPLNNEWSDDWVKFYCQQRLEPQMNMEEVKGDREAHQLWGRLIREIPNFFHDIEIHPALVHGDLWSGNVSQISGQSTKQSATESTAIPVIFDPASFYGHDEFEFGIITMFGGFETRFFDAYHSVIPERPGHRKRLLLYQLFHHLNHWNHFGSGYRGSSVSLMKKLLS